MTFYEWLVARGQRSDSIGIIARYALMNADFPTAPGLTRSHYRFYMFNKGASTKLLDRLNDALTEYHATKDMNADLRSCPDIDQPYYFGCADGDLGHYAWDAKLFMRTDVPKDVSRWLSGRDGKFPPTYIGEREGVMSHFIVGKEGKEGTIVACWDRSMDKRPGSHSTFLIPGVLTKEDAITAARIAFPTVFERFEFEVT